MSNESVAGDRPGNVGCIVREALFEQILECASGEDGHAPFDEHLQQLIETLEQHRLEHGC